MKITIYEKNFVVISNWVSWVEVCADRVKYDHTKSSKLLVNVKYAKKGKLTETNERINALEI